MICKRLASVMVASVLVAACGGDPDATAPSTTQAAATPATTSAQPASTTTAIAGETTTTAATGAPPGGTGEASLTVGDQVYEFDNYYCRVGSENTGNANIAFSSGAFGEVEGNRAQLDASVYDAEAQNRMDGNVVRSVTLNDVDDFTSPKVAWVAESGMQADPVEFGFDGSTLRVETTFDDARTDEMEEIPGVLEATCGQ